MVTGNERRSSARSTEVSPISLCDSNGSGRAAGLLFNRSETGIYFETDCRLEPETRIYVALQASESHGVARGVTFRLARVAWCRSLEKDAPYAYGCGASLMIEATPAALPELVNRRRHPRSPFPRQVRIASRGRITGAVAGDISASGMFIRSDRQPRAGESLTLSIPDKTGQPVVVRAKVVWSSAAGFGLKFIR